LVHEGFDRLFVRTIFRPSCTFWFVLKLVRAKLLAVAIRAATLKIAHRVAAVTTIVLPHARRLPDANLAIARPLSGGLRGRRAFQSCSPAFPAFTCSSGWRLAAWGLFESVSFWWLHLMIALWIVFVLMLFVFEPLGIDRLFRSYALREKDHAFALATRLHWVALVIVTFTIGAGVLGAHGYLL
jgi:hypothetical protein